MYRPIIRNLYVLCFEVTMDFQVGNVWADHEIWVDEKSYFKNYSFEKCQGDSSLGEFFFKRLLQETVSENK